MYSIIEAMFFNEAKFHHFVKINWPNNINKGFFEKNDLNLLDFKIKKSPNFSLGFGKWP
jgi:hypothetical protein